MGLKVFFNGNFIDSSEAKVSIFDHGLLYGDGVFEGIRSYNRKVFRLRQHMERLYKGAGEIRLSIPLSIEEFESRIIETLKLNQLGDAYIRVVVTRGPGDLGLDPRKCSEPTIFIITDKISLYPAEFYEKGLPIIIAKTRRTNPDAVKPTIKSLNYLNSILGKIEATDAGVDEALMLTVDGYIAECTGDNVFIVKGNKLMTPPSDVGALDGITKKAVIELAGNRGIGFDYTMLKPDDVFAADECFLTGTAAELIPVVRVDGKVIGSGMPGELTKQLTADFRVLTETEGVEY